jgi:hypothetical protein
MRFLSLLGMLACLWQGSLAAEAIFINNSGQTVHLRSSGPGDTDPYNYTVPSNTYYHENQWGLGHVIKLSAEIIDRPGPPVAHIVWGYSNQPDRPT